VPHVLGAGEEGVLDDVAVDVPPPADAGVGTTVGEAGQGVVVRGVHRVGQRVTEHLEVGGVAVAVQEQHVPGVDGADRRLEATVEGPDDLAARVTRFVDRVVPGDPFLVLVAVGDHLP
jgi:hypothetical protein